MVADIRPAAARRGGVFPPASLVPPRPTPPGHPGLPPIHRRRRPHRPRAHPPELASDVVDRGIVLTGGASLLRNLDRLVTREIGISCYIADNPLECVAMGAAIALDHLDLIKRSMPAEGEWLVSF